MEHIIYKYVVIDDEPLICEGVIKQLRSLEDRLTCAGTADNGERALKLIRETIPDIAIIDMQMPIMDGAQLLPNLAGNYENLQLIVISGHKDFDYMKAAIASNAIDYLLKPFSREQLIDTVEKALEKLHSRLWITNQISAGEEQKEQAYYTNDIQTLKYLILEYEPEKAVFCSQKLTYITATHHFFLMTLYTSAKLEEEAVRCQLENIGMGSFTLFLPHMNNLNLGFVLLFLPEKSLLGSRKLCVQIAENLIDWSHSSGISARIGISCIHDDIRELNQAYNESCVTLDNQKIADENKDYYFYYETPDPVFVSWDKTEEFLFRMESGTSQKTAGLLEELYHYYSTIPDFTLNDAKLHYYQLTNQCMAILSSYSKQFQYSNSMQNIVKSIFDLEELHKYYTRFFCNLADILRENSVYAGDNIIEKIKIYIDRNYQKRLSIDLLSCLFYLSPTYLSHLFHMETGVKFIDYINEVRIGHAKELLLGTNYKMYQIAKMAGYDNTKYFFRIFKKHTGVTPKQFKQNL